MISSEFLTFQTETNGLRGYLETTHGVRMLLPRVPRSSEPSILEFDLINLSKSAPDSARWRVMEHSLVIGRLYALYESYCERVLSDWLGFLTESYPYADLPHKIKDSYSKGFSTIIGMLPSPRYSNLEIGTLVSDYNSALQGVVPYTLSHECLVHHKNNLRLDELRDIFLRCGVEGLDGWISGSPSLIGFFSDNPTRVADQVSSRLTNFIQYRNDSSHGSVAPDEILGFDELVDLIDFICALAEAIDEFILWKALEIKVAGQKARRAGKITEVFKKAQACILKTDDVELSIEQVVYIRKAGGFKISQILSMQVDDVSEAYVDAKLGTEIGLRMNHLPEMGSEIYVVLPD